MASQQSNHYTMTATNGSDSSTPDSSSLSKSKQKKATQAKKKEKMTAASAQASSSSVLPSNEGSTVTDAPVRASTSSVSSPSSFSRVSCHSCVPVVPPFDSRRLLTSSSLAAANALVDMLIQFVRDAYKAAEAHQSFIQKTYVLEVMSGANHGRNLWQFLVALSERAGELADIVNIALPSRGQKMPEAHEANHNTLAALTPFASHFTYILTDPLQSHLDNFKQHPQLAPFFDVGLVEIAQFDPTDPTAFVIHGAAQKGAAQSQQSMELYLQYSSSLLTSLDSHNPILVISNEVMAAAPPAAPSAATKGKSASSAAVACNWKFDAYCYEPQHPHQLKEYQLATRQSEKPSAFPAIEWNLSQSPIANLKTQYTQPEYNAVLERYVHDLDEIAFPSPTSPPQPIFVNTLPKAATSAVDAPSQTFTLPITAFNFLYSLRQFARGPLLLLVAERGFSSLVTLPNQVPSLGFATSRSTNGAMTTIPIPVNLLNLHAMQVLTKEMKGYTLAQSSRTVSTVRVSGFGFESAPTAEDEELEPLPLPNRTASPVKSAMKSPSSPREVSDYDGEEKVAASEESNGINGGSGKKVKFLGLTWKEQKALKKAERERQQQLAAQQAHRHALASHREIPPPANVSCAFLRNYQIQNPFEASSLLQLCLANAAVTNPVVNGSKAVAPQYPSLTSKHALSLLSSSYEVDSYMRLKSLIFSPFPSSPKKIASHLRAQVFYPNSPMEFDLFQSLRRVWSSYIALPADIYGVLPSHANTDLAYEFGTFFMLRRRFRTALAYFQRSLDIFLPRPVTLFNMAQCWIKLKAFVPAREKLQQALAADPSYQQAQQWLDWIESQIGSDQDRSRDDASEKADIESAFQDPYQEMIGEIEEDEEPEVAPVEESKVPEATTHSAPIALPPTTITLEQARAQEALVEKMRGMEMKDDSVDESERAKQIEKKKAFREKEKARKAEKKRQATEQKQQQQANGSTPSPAVNGAADSHSKSASAALPAPIQTSSTQNHNAVPSSAQSTPSISASPAGSPTLQSFLKPTSSRLWSEMEDDEELPHPLSPSKSLRVPSQEKLKNHDHPQKQQSKQQNGPPHHQSNAGMNKTKNNDKDKPSPSDRFARPSESDADGSKPSSKQYQPPNKRNQSKSNAQ